MQYLGLALLVGLLALVCGVVALRVLLGGNWLLGWLRGTLGLLILAVSAVVGLIAWDVTSYQVLPSDKPLATLSFQRQGPQQFRVTLQEHGEERLYEMRGDLWQLDVRVLQFKGLAAILGFQTAYRLEALAGRYLALEQQNNSLPSHTPLASSLYGIDFWRWLRESERDLMMFKPEAGRVTFLPMADGALFAVRQSATGLLVEPLNQAAEQALQDWQ
ncbi:hypothetical protein [Atopomonas sediminilitoris]|uniref:hypothetical protein n=1 Tax=Atopomonas sediminilitoris TaxID=2919919 RepID=UPI001F4EF59B|nr:hypothetical protein [Atopomonas sediminilitoris]MCJ8168009.1 hypothetical protein [Atopomonas sediminilitoris]